MTGDLIENEGVMALCDALKINTSLQKLNVSCEEDFRLNF